MPIPQLSKKKTSREKPANKKKRRKLKTKPSNGNDMADDFKDRAIAQKKATRRKKKNWKTYLKKTVWVCLILTALGIIFTIGVFAWVSRELPDPDRISEIVPVNSIRFYDRTGETLLFEKGDVIQQAVEWDNVPANLKYATLSLEDKKFYEHHGFSLNFP